MAFTLALNDSWDIFCDENGNIATLTDAYAIAQNCANAVRLFTNDAYFNKDRGIPHFDIELGKKPIPAKSTLINRITNALMGVDGVLDCQVTLNFDNTTRTYTGEAYVTTNSNTTIQIGL